ncbi:MAG: hypothetical protein ACKVOO_12370 [Burkholderiaceae bacterium]
MSEIIFTAKPATATPAIGKAALYLGEDGRLYVQGATGAPVRLAIGEVAGAQLGQPNVFTRNQSVAPVAVDGSEAVFTPDAALSNNFTLDVLYDNSTVIRPLNVSPGMVLNYTIRQDGTGGKRVNFDASYRFPGGQAPVLSIAPNAVDFMSCYFDAAADALLCNLARGFA